MSLFSLDEICEGCIHVKRCPTCGHRLGCRKGCEAGIEVDCATGRCSNKETESDAGVD